MNCTCKLQVTVVSSSKQGGELSCKRTAANRSRPIPVALAAARAIGKSDHVGGRGVSSCPSVGNGGRAMARISGAAPGDLDSLARSSENLFGVVHP